MKANYISNISVFDKTTEGLLIEPETLGEKEILLFFEKIFKYKTSIKICYIEELAKVINHNEGLLIEPSDETDKKILKEFEHDFKILNTDFDKIFQS